MMVCDELSNVRIKYKILEVLGSGSFGTVRKCALRETGELFACKTIKKEVVDDPKNLRREIDILRTVDHPNIIKFQDVYEDEKYIHLVTELCTGGELYDRVIEYAENGQGHFHEEDAALLISEIFDAIRYLHDKCHIVHRDLKPENFLLKDESEHAPIKIIDFGLSRKDDAPFGIMNSRVGTPYYVAPEVLLHEYTYKVDVWSVGVIAYILLCGFAPFSGETDIDTLNLVSHGELEFPSPEWDDISSTAKDFVQKLLDRNPDRRPTADEALHHPWIRQYVDVKPGIPKPVPFNHRGVSESSVISMKSDRRFAFQKLLNAVKVEKNLKRVASLLSPTEAGFLARVFRKVDKDNDGRITIQDIDQAVMAGSLSASVRDNLKELRTALEYSTRKTSFDVRPFIAMAEEKKIQE